MSCFIDSIRRKYPKCISNSCAAPKCRLLVGRISRDCLAILELDRYTHYYANTNCKMCDFLVFHYEGDITVCAAELKGGSIKAKEARDQIQEGARLAERIMSNYRTRKFFPILVHNRTKKWHFLDYKFFQNTRIKFQNVEAHIGIVPSGTYLEDIFTGTGSSR